MASPKEIGREQGKSVNGCSLNGYLGTKIESIEVETASRITNWKRTYREDTIMLKSDARYVR